MIGGRPDQGSALDPPKGEPFGNRSSAGRHFCFSKAAEMSMSTSSPIIGT